MALAGLAAYASSGSSSDDDEDACDEGVGAAASEPPAAKRARTVVAVNDSNGDSVQAATVALPPPPLPDDESAPRAACAAGADGRIRQFAHVDGLFATHIYLPVHPDPSLAAALQRSCSALAAARGDVHTLAPTEYHVSLSRTVTLSRGQLDGFQDALRRALRGRAAARVPLTGSLVELANDSRTRHFAALELAAGTSGHASVSGLVDAVDAVLARYGLPVFYDERRLHFSVAWSLQPLPAPLPALAGAGGHVLTFDRVECRVGERVTEHRLRQPEAHSSARAPPPVA